jgi:hypothetical protein
MSPQGGSEAVSVEEYVRALQVPPSRPWQSARGSEPGLAYVAVMRLDVDRAGELGILGGRLAFLDRAHAGDSRVAAVHGDSRVRISSVGSGAFGKDYVHVRDGTQEGFLYLCPSLRCYLHLPRPPRQGSGPQPGGGAAPDGPAVKWAIQMGGQAVAAGRACQVVTLTAVAPFLVRWQLWLCADEELRPFALPVATVMTGAPAAVADVVAGYGLPVRGTLSFGSPVAFPEPASSFWLDGLELRTVTDPEFNVPPGYADMRRTREGQRR